MLNKPPLPPHVTLELQEEFVAEALERVYELENKRLFPYHSIPDSALLQAQQNYRRELRDLKKMQRQECKV